MCAAVEAGHESIGRVGNDQVAVDDILGIGKAIEVKFKGDNVNMFSVLARAGKVKQAASGQAQGRG
ncbi:hypothetical protein A2U01_0043536, partial [Trifolium medium]|nr:hypothetical protein [Trifolium medium]